ncbi:MAG TPA: hypothetical protein DDY39_08155 [Nitrospira sp.]|nr:hypothetical protein [Nitrospira sp.]HBR51665.1 hypothetical protein [Nitrospira sp.]
MALHAHFASHTFHVSFLRISPIAFVLGELGFRGAAWFFSQQYLEVLQAEPGGDSLSRYGSLN